MTRWCTRGGVLMRLARLRASVEHNGQRSNSQSEDGCGCNSCRPEHLFILLQGYAGLSPHDKHAGHSTTAFRDRFWISLLSTVPPLIWGHITHKRSAALGR
jgi:hypothetical protein